MLYGALGLEGGVALPLLRSAEDSGVPIRAIPDPFALIVVVVDVYDGCCGDWMPANASAPAANGLGCWPRGSAISALLARDKTNRMGAQAR
jgi:hypothetical protein